MKDIQKRYRLGEWYMFNKDYCKALRAFQDVIEVNPTYNVHEGLTALDQIRKCYHGLKSADFIRGHEEAQTDDDLVGGLKRGFYGLPIMFYQIKSSCINDYIEHERIDDKRIRKQMQKHLKKYDKREIARHFFLQAANDINKLGARWDTFRRSKNRMTLKNVIDLEPGYLDAYGILAKDYFRSKLYDRTLYYLKKLEDQSHKYYQESGLSYLELKAMNLLKKEAFRDTFFPDSPDDFPDEEIFSEDFRKKR